jgi:hypothetical protein
MTNSKSVKLEFSQTSPTQYFDIYQGKHDDKIHCTAKASGKQGVNYFSSKFKFVVVYKNSFGRIKDIKINDVTHIGKSTIPIKKCGKYHYYYDINCPDNSSDSSSSIIDDQFELTVYDAIKTMLINATVTKVGCFIRVTLNIPTGFDSMCARINIGTDKYANSSSYCNDCSLSAVSKSGCSSSSSCHKSSSSSSSSCSSSSSSSSCNCLLQKLIKLIAWSAVISFIVYTIKKKFCVNISLTVPKSEEPVIEYKPDDIILDGNVDVNVNANTNAAADE